MPNKLYIAPETTIEWLNTGGDLDCDIGGLAANAVQMGAYHDMGAASHAEQCKIEMLIDGFDTQPVEGETVDLYLSFSDETTGFDGKPTTDPTASAEGTMTVAQLKNCLRVDSAVVVSTVAADVLKITAIVRIPARYVSPVVHNNTADALLSTADAHSIKLTKIPPEVQ
jgi:hypothetical protein